MTAAALTLAAVLALAARPECGGNSGLPPDRLAAVAKVESAFNPLSIHVNHPDQELSPATIQDAIRIATALIAAGKSVDLGLMQINNAELRGMSLAQAFDPCASLAAGAAHLADDVRAVLRQSHQRYNTGSTDRGQGYANAIEQALGSIQAGGAPTASPPATFPAVSVVTEPEDPPCAPIWDAWALAACSEPSRPARTTQANSASLHMKE